MKQPYGRRPPYLRRNIGFARTATLVAIGAMLSASLLVLSTTAHSAPINADQEAFEYWAHHGSHICAVLDQTPTIDGIATAGLDIINHSNLTVKQAGQVVGLAIHFTCPQHQQLIDQFASSINRPERAA